MPLLLFLSGFCLLRLVKKLHKPECKMLQQLSLRTARFGLHKDPFSMTPDPAMLYLTERHREALAGLTYAIMRRQGFIVLTGEVGTGKTTLLARLRKHLPPENVLCSHIVHPKLSSSEFLEMALAGWGILNPPESKAQRLLLLRDFLLAAHAGGKTAVLIVDEAHVLSASVLEEIRLLGNFEEADQKLLQIILAGQNELADLLNREDLRQIKQRIAVRLNIDRLSQHEIEGYIRHRWIKAGGDELPFSKEALSEIAHWSRGIPRVINAICGNALTLLVAQDLPVIGPEHIREVCTDLDITPIPVAVPAPSSAPAAPASPPVVSAAREATVPPAPSPEPDPEWAYVLKSFERYAPAKRKTFFARWVGRLWA